MPIVSTQKMTARQFLQLGEDPPGVRLELVDGEIAVSASPIPAHSYAVLKLAQVLLEHVEGRDLGQVLSDVDTLFGENDVRRPDILFFAKDRLHLIGERAIEGPPDLCVEVVSPSSGRIDREDKYQQYQRAGVAHYWLLDPRLRTLEGYRLESGAYAAAGRAEGAAALHLPPFPDLPVPLARLWRPT